MTTKITPEAVKERIAALESAGELSLKEQFYLEALRLLVAGMDSDPVAWLLSGGGAKNVVCFDSGNAYADPLREVTPLYRHGQPAPVVPNEVEHVAAVLELIGSFEAADIDSDTVDLRFEIDDVDTGSDASITEYAARGAAIIRMLAGNSPVIPDGMLKIGYMFITAEGGTAFSISDVPVPGMTLAGPVYAPAVKAGEQQNAPQNIPEIIPDSCTWTFSNYDDHWSGTCGVEWIFPDGGPEENGVKFCPKCGKSVAVSATEGTEE